MSAHVEEDSLSLNGDWTFARYLRSRARIVLFCVLGIALCWGILGVAGVAWSFRALTSVVLLSFLMLGLIAEYMNERKFWKDLQALSDRMDRAWQLPSLVESPDFAEGEVAYDALRAMGAAASDAVHASEQQIGDYRDYIELWVHEVKAPIASARLVADRVSGADAAMLKTDLERINRDVEQALFFARSTSFERDFSISEFEIAPVAMRACKDNARFLIDKGCVPEFSIPAGTVVFGDPKWVTFILSQLVVNAAKYDARTVKFSARLLSGEASDVKPVPERDDSLSFGDGPLTLERDASSHSEAAETLFLEVADNGCGIPAQDVPRVFDRGFTGENGRAYTSATGMGLYLCAVMCQKMGISIEVASEEGKGTRVVLGFPFDRRRFDDVSSL